MDHTVDLCPITKLDGGLLSIHEADDVINWRKTMAMKALAKRIKSSHGSFSENTNVHHRLLRNMQQEVLRHVSFI